MRLPRQGPSGPAPRRILRARAALIAGAFAAAGIATGCEREEPRLPVALTESPAAPETARTPDSSRALRVAVASVLTPPGTLLHYGRLVEYLGESLGVPTEMIQRPNYAETNELMRVRHCQIAFMCNYAFLRAQREFGAEMVAAPIIAGRPDYQAYVIVNRDSPVRSMADLRGRRFAFADPLCNAGWLFPRYRLRQLGLSPDGYFGGEVFTYDYARSIQAVASGLADAAGVEGPLYDWLTSQHDPDALRTRILERSAPFGNPPVVVHPGLGDDLRKRIRGFFLSLHESERGRLLLSGIMVDRFQEPDAGIYVSITHMEETLERP